MTCKFKMHVDNYSEIYFNSHKVAPTSDWNGMGLGPEITLDSSKIVQGMNTVFLLMVKLGVRLMSTT